MEDDDEDGESDADGGGDVKGKGKARDEGLHLSKSVAQERLRLLFEKTASNYSGSAEAERRRLYDEAGTVPWASANNNGNNHHDTTNYAPQPPTMTRAVTAAAAPVCFPHSLPTPAPPSSPRTTRQQMLRNEMSESLRHNLLWQRKLSRGDLVGPQPRRTKSTVNVPNEGGRQAEKGLVRLTPGAAPERCDPAPPLREGGVKKKLVRNLSWADASDYHTAAEW
ncbi:hypothetical protein C8J57DRAFT_1291066 [Mycena rebaudengoi]|nr:hypothetical protein C8J57DRAFT_1291066 [Mycena rebaudengoi]